MTNTTITRGGVKNAVGDRVSADQSTILGDGTTERPLHAAPLEPIAETVVFHGASFQFGKSVNTWSYPTGNGVSVNAGATAQDNVVVVAVCPLDFPIGTQFREIRARIVDNATGPTKLTAQLWAVSDFGVGTPVSTSPESAGDGTRQTLVVQDPGPDFAVVNDTSAYSLVLLTTPQVAALATWSVYYAQVDVVRPPNT